MLMIQVSCPVCFIKKEICLDRLWQREPQRHACALCANTHSRRLALSAVGRSVAESVVWTAMLMWLIASALFASVSEHRLDQKEAR